MSKKTKSFLKVIGGLIVALAVYNYAVVPVINYVIALF